MYPFATQNAKDFENLLSVYLDAAFFPQLREQDFRLVCWHYILAALDCYMCQLTLTSGSLPVVVSLLISQ